MKSANSQSSQRNRVSVDLSESDKSRTLDTLRGLAYWECKPWETHQTRLVSPVDLDPWLSQGLNAFQTAAVLLDAKVDFAQANERTFMCFFAARAIESLILAHWREFEKLHATGSQYQAAMSLAELVGILLSDAPMVPRVETLIRVLAEYGHQVLGVPESLSLKRHLDIALRSEPALHALKPFYRDHFFHAVEVCLIGFALLSSHISRETTLGMRIIENCRGGDFAPADRVSLLRQWWVAALTHDVGYTIELLKGSLQMMDFFEKHRGIREFVKRTYREMDQLREHLKDFPELESDSNLSSDHGVIGAAHLNALVKTLGKNHSHSFDGAIRAIAFHNSRHATVDARHDPIAALLILCDSLQEWRRAHLGFGHAPVIMMSRMMEGSEVPNQSEFGAVGRFHFSIGRMGTGDPPKHQWHQADQLTVALEYENDVNRNSRVFFLWLDASYNLQRVNIAPFGFEVAVKYNTPIRPDGRTQLDRLAACVEEREITTVKPWVETARSQIPERAVEHRAEGEREILTVNVKRLGQAFGESPLLRGGINDFNKELTQWRHYREDRDDQEDGRIQKPG